MMKNIGKNIGLMLIIYFAVSFSEIVASSRNKPTLSAADIEALILAGAVKRAEREQNKELLRYIVSSKFALKDESGNRLVSEKVSRASMVDGLSVNSLDGGSGINLFGETVPIGNKKIKKQCVDPLCGDSSCAQELSPQPESGVFEEAVDVYCPPCAMPTTASTPMSVYSGASGDSI